MLYTGAKKDALAIHERAAKKYNATLEMVQKRCEELYTERQNSVHLIEAIESLVNSIAKHPKDFDKSLSLIEAECTKFHETEEYAKEAYQAAVKSGASIAAGIAGGATIASMAPTAAMWVATTFGTASTGTAISALSGAVATKAALAWLGGGALAAGGTGMAGGQALLALAGPIGWGISGVTTVVSVTALGIKNKKISDEAIEEAKKITVAGAGLNETGAKISTIIDETKLLFANLSTQYSQNKHFEHANYTSLTSDEQLLLGTTVNNTLSLAELLNKIVK